MSSRPSALGWMTSSGESSEDRAIRKPKSFVGSKGYQENVPLGNHHDNNKNEIDNDDDDSPFRKLSMRLQASKNSLSSTDNPSLLTHDDVDSSGYYHTVSSNALDPLSPPSNNASIHIFQSFDSSNSSNVDDSEIYDRLTAKLGSKKT